MTNSKQHVEQKQQNKQQCTWQWWKEREWEDGLCVWQERTMK